MLGNQIVIKPRDASLLIRSACDARRIARTVFDKGRHFTLLGFGTADNHLHVDTLDQRDDAMEFGRRIALSLGRTLRIESGFADVYLEPIRNAAHRRNTFEYVLRQQQRHQLLIDPLREASSLPDLLGARLLGRYTAANVRRALPRLSRQTLLRLLGVETLVVRRGGPEDTLGAGLVAAGLSRLEGSGQEASSLRIALCELLGDQLTTNELALMLETSPRTVRRLRRRPADALLVHAIGLQVDLARQKATQLEAAQRPFF
jgi:hypothetical protein